MCARARIAIVAAALLAACADPPNREMDHAQGAIDAARAAGAEQYAAQELAAAVTALAQARETVAQGDYRSALTYALDSRERAQNAAKQASDDRVSIGSQTERVLTETGALLDRGDQRLAVAEAQKVPRRTITKVQSVLTNSRKTLQEASAAAERGDYQAAQRELNGVSQRIRAAIDEIDRAIAARQPRPRR
jgi:Domain of unknown function (DUF4398)